MAHAVLVAKYPNSQFCTFRFENCARSSYQGTQYYLTNTRTNWQSGWQNTPPVSIYNGTSSNFNISMSPGDSYTVQTRMMWNNVWYNGAYPYEPISFYFEAPTPQRPTGSPYVTHYNSKGTTISLQIQNAYGATEIGFTPSWGGTYNSTVYNTPYIYTLYAPQYGTEYEIGKKGYNAGGESSRTTLYATTEPAIPSISKGGSGGENTLIINVNPGGGFTTIEVEMWDIYATSRLATRNQGWNGGGSFTVQFGGLVANASYLFRARALKTSNNSSYHPVSDWGGWLTVKNEMARPVNWNWYTAKASGAEFNILATEWNAFTTKINQFRMYRGLGNATFTSAVRGQPFYFYQFNEARNAINSMRSTGLGTVTTGDVIYASHLNSLSNTLNAIT